MSNEELNHALYEKMFAEQEKFRDWLLGQPPEEIINHCYTYTVREDILMALEYNDLSDDQVRALLASPTPLEDVFKEFEKMETDHMENIWSCIESRADDMLARDRVPLYAHPASYAREHDELDDYRSTSRANIACKEAIETAISDNYRDNRLDTSCVKPIMERFGENRVAYVLAATIQVKDWDERFSHSNKAWAATIPVVNDGNDIMGDRRTRFVVDRPHSGLTDLFITAFREEQQKQREQPERMSIYDQLRQPAPQTAAPKKSKAAAQEL